MLRGQVDQVQEASERLAATDRLISLHNKRIIQLENQLPRIQEARRDAEDIIDRIDVQIFQIKIVAAGFLLLLLLAIVGVGIPLFILPVDSNTDGRQLGWIAQRGTLALIGCLITYVWAVFVMSEAKPYFDSRRERLTSLLWFCLMVFWLLWPYAGGHWVVIVVGWSLNVLAIGTWAFRQWTNRGSSPTESQSDGLRIRHRKRTNLFR